MLAARYIDNKVPAGPTFSVCSLVRYPANYDRLLRSFERLGFTSDNAEFLAADNRRENQFDGYSWQKTLLAEARGEFVIFCHDDVELIDAGYDALLARIAELDALDPSWLLAGVAGGVWHADKAPGHGLALHISDLAGEDRRKGNLPGRVETLDECFILMRRTRPVVGSSDLTGFHYYGPDLCLQAELAGGSAYAIDFHLRHHGAGLMGPEFQGCKRRFISKYRQYFPDRKLRCTTGKIKFRDEPS